MLSPNEAKNIKTAEKYLGTHIDKYDNSEAGDGVLTFTLPFSQEEGGSLDFTVATSDWGLALTAFSSADISKCRSRMAEFVNLANLEIELGRFEYDAEGDVLDFRINIVAGEDRPVVEEQIDLAFQAAVLTMQNYLPGVLDMAEDKELTAQEAVDGCGGGCSCGCDDCDGCHDHECEDEDGWDEEDDSDGEEV